MNNHISRDEIKEACNAIKMTNLTIDWLDNLIKEYKFTISLREKCPKCGAECEYLRNSIGSHALECMCKVLNPSEAWYNFVEYLRTKSNHDLAEHIINEGKDSFLV